MRLPNYVKHVAHPLDETRTWCGKPRDFDFTFTGLDHVASNALEEGRYVACEECMEAAMLALDAGSFENQEPETLGFIQRLCKRLHEDTQFQSGVDRDNEWYRTLVTFSRPHEGPNGDQYLRSILWLLERGEADDPIPFWHLFSVLGEATGEDPVSPEHRGVWVRVRDAWVDWGRQCLA